MPTNKILTPPLPRFPDGAVTPIVSSLRGAPMAFTRIGLGQHLNDLHVQFEPQDAYFVIFQLQDAPSHEHWENGRARLAPPSPCGSLHISNLNAAPGAVLNDAIDSINMVLPRAFLDALAEDSGVRPVDTLRVPEPWQTQDTVMTQLAPILLQALEDGKGAGDLFIERLASATAMHLAHRYGGMRRPVIRAGGLAPWQEKRAREMIAANLAKEVSLAEVAEACSLSLSHFAKAFRITTGLTPHGWLQTCRIARARDLLRRPSPAFADIALHCGFADQSHFTRIFKRETGATPGAWRRLNRH